MSGSRAVPALALVCLVLAACDSPLTPGRATPADSTTARFVLTPSAAAAISGLDSGLVYSAVDLGRIGSGPFQSAMAINNLGHVTGISEASHGVPLAFFWMPDGGIRAIGTGSGVGSETRDINASDEVAGTIHNADGSLDAFTWSPTGGMHVLGRFGKASAQGMGINDQGQVVGYFTDDDPTSPTFGVQAYLWSPGGSLQVLPAVPTSAPISPFNISLDVDNNDEVTGLTLQNPLDPNSNVVAYYWSPTNGGSQSLGSLGSTYQSYSVWSINDQGVVAGAAQGTDPATGAPTITPFLWTRAGGFQNLRDEGFPSNLYGSAVRANSLGYVAVSVVDPSTGIRNPSVWIPRYGLVYLPTLGGDNGEVFGINDLGQAVGWSQNAAGDTVATLWNLVPPPTDAIGGQIAAIDQIGASQSTAVAATLGRATAQLRSAVAAMAKNDPDEQQFLRLLDKAIDEIDEAVRKGFDPALAAQLEKEQITVARSIVQKAIDDALTAGTRPDRLRPARRALAAGDSRAAKGRYDQAVDDYVRALREVERTASRSSDGRHHESDHHGSSGRNDRQDGRRGRKGR